MTHPKYNSLTNSYDPEIGDSLLDMRQIDISDRFALYSLVRTSSDNVNVLLIEEGYSFPGAKRLAQNYTSFETNSAVYVVADRVTGILQGLDRVQFMQDFPPPSSGHIPLIVDLGDENFSLAYKVPEYVGLGPINSDDELVNPNLEMIVTA